jgi:hypothetical protein
MASWGTLGEFVARFGHTYSSAINDAVNSTTIDSATTVAVNSSAFETTWMDTCVE